MISLSTVKCHLCCIHSSSQRIGSWSHHVKPFVLRLCAGDHPCWWLFQSFSVGWQAEHSISQPRPHSLKPKTQDLRQGLVFHFPVLMFVLLDSCKSLPSDVQVRGKGNGNPSWRQQYNLLTFLICWRENGSLSTSPLLTGGLFSSQGTLTVNCTVLFYAFCCTVNHTKQVIHAVKYNYGHFLTVVRINI